MQRLFPGERVLLPTIYTLIYLYAYPIYINSLTNFEALSLHPLIIIVYLPCISYIQAGKPANFRGGHFYVRLRSFYMAVPYPRVEC